VTLTMDSRIEAKNPLVPISISLANRAQGAEKRSPHHINKPSRDPRECLSPRMPIVGLRTSGEIARRGMFDDNLGACCIQGKETELYKSDLPK